MEKYGAQVDEEEVKVTEEWAKHDAEVGMSYGEEDYDEFANACVMQDLTKSNTLDLFEHYLSCIESLAVTGELDEAYSGMKEYICYMDGSEFCRVSAESEEDAIAEFEIIAAEQGKSLNNTDAYVELADAEETEEDESDGVWLDF